jgi:hypothetical protein
MIDKPPPQVASAAAIVQRWLDDTTPAVPKTAEEMAKMSHADRLDHCRRFDQKKNARLAGSSIEGLTNERCDRSPGHRCRKH